MKTPGSGSSLCANNCAAHPEHYQGNHMPLSSNIISPITSVDASLLTTSYSPVKSGIFREWNIILPFHICKQQIISGYFLIVQMNVKYKSNVFSNTFVVKRTLDI